MKRLGFEHVANLPGGMRRWRALHRVRRASLFSAQSRPTSLARTASAAGAAGKITASPFSPPNPRRPPLDEPNSRQRAQAPSCQVYRAARLRWVAAGVDPRTTSVVPAASFGGHLGGLGQSAQLRRLLVFETRMQVDAFLKEHEIFDYSAADFEQDRETLRELRMREARP